MSALGEKIKAARAVVEALMAMCSHSSLHPVCKLPNSALACDDCGIVIKGGVLSAHSWDDGA